MRTFLLLTVLLGAGASTPARADDQPRLPRVLRSDFDVQGQRPALVEALARFQVRAERARLQPDASDRDRAAATLEQVRLLEE